MLVFPQPTTGAAALHPVIRKHATRTVANVLGDGRTVVFADPDAGIREWELRATGLTLEEWTAIEDAVPGRVGKVYGVHISGSGGQPAAAQRGVRRAGVGQRSTDSADAGSRRPTGNHAGDAGGQRGLGCGRGSTDAGGAGEFPVRAQRVGENDGWIKRDALGNDSRRECDTQYRADEPVDTSFPGNQSGVKYGQRGVRGAAGCRRVGGLVRDATAGAARRVGLQENRSERRCVRKRAVCRGRSDCDCARGRMCSMR